MKNHTIQPSGQPASAKRSAEQAGIATTKLIAPCPDTEGQDSNKRRKALIYWSGSAAALARHGKSTGFTPKQPNPQGAAGDKRRNLLIYWVGSAAARKPRNPT